MDREAFEQQLETLQLDDVSPSQTQLNGQARPTPTMVFAPLPPMHLGSPSRPMLELGETIGEGGMGRVRSARQIALHREVAVKTLREERSGENERAALLHEALITGGLQHPNIVPVYSLGETEDRAPVIVMKRVEGVSWAECIEAPERAPGFDPSDPLFWHLDIFMQVCQAAHFAHSQQILHRDIKPANVMLGAFGEVYLVDWGIAVTLDDTVDHLIHVTAAGGPSGTPAYMAPEMAIGVGADLGVLSDVYLLGATLFHALTGNPPHDADNVMGAMVQAYESVPVESDVLDFRLREICRRAMSRAPSERFESAEALRFAVAKYKQQRESIRLSERAEISVEQLEQAIRTGEEGREIAAHARFGIEQALDAWPDNPAAHAVYQRWLRQMVTLQIRRNNLTEAESWMAEISEPAPELVQRLDKLRGQIEVEEDERAELERVRADADLSHGADLRTKFGVVSVIVWTILPLVSGWLTAWGAEPLSPARYVAQSAFLVTFVLAMSLISRRAKQNDANQRIVNHVLMYVLVIPIYRTVTTIASVPTPLALAIENTIYGLAFAGVAIASGQRGYFPLAVYCIAALVGAYVPQLVHPCTAIANLCALSWLVAVWSRQSPATEALSPRHRDS